MLLASPESLSIRPAGKLDSSIGDLSTTVAEVLQLDTPKSSQGVRSPSPSYFGSSEIAEVCTPVTPDSARPIDRLDSGIDDLSSTIAGSFTLDSPDNSPDLLSPSSSYVDSSDVSAVSTPDASDSTYTISPETEDYLLLPNHPYFNVEYQKVLEENKMLCGVIEDELRATKDTNLKSLTQLAQTIAAGSSRVTRTIAVLGDSGVGKSALLNSLLDCPGLAQEGDIGEAVTSVATEFRYLEGEDSAFSLEVEYQTKAEIEETIKEYVWNYQSLHLPDIDKEYIGAEEYRKLEHKAKIASDALGVLFGHHKDLQKVYARQDEHSYDSAVAQLLQWSQDLQWPTSVTDGKWHYMSNDAEDCSEALSDFTSGNLWPLLKVARVYLKSPLLQHGIILVDLPGLRDSNDARVKATQEYLAKVDHVLIIANITRAKSNESVINAQGLFNVMSQNFPNKWENAASDHGGLTIVCTRSEEMDLKNMEREFVKRLKLIPKNEIEELKSKEQDAVTDQEKKQWKRARRYRFMEARNNFVISGIKKSYLEAKPYEQLKVFCVSNKEYKQGRNKKDNQRITMSQIRTLREHCFKLVADHRLTEAQNFLMSALPGLLQSIKLYTAPKPRVDQTLLDALSATEEQLLFIEDLMEEEFKRIIGVAVSCSISLKFLSVRNSSDWTEAASSTHREYTDWHHTSYAAFIRNYGTHSTATVGYHQWNNEMSAQMRLDLSGYWKNVQTLLQDYMQNLSNLIKENMTQLSTKNKELSGFSRAVRLLVPSIELELINIQNTAIHQVRFVQSRVTEDNKASFFFAAMLPAYRDAAGISGKGKHRAQISRMTSPIQEGLFTGILDKVHDALNEVFNDTNEKLQDLRTSSLSKLDGDLKALRRKITAKASTGPIMDYSMLRNLLKKWSEASEKGIALAQGVEAQMQGDKMLA